MRHHLEKSERQIGSRPATAQEPTRAAGRLARFHRVSWREALSGFASAAFRLHHYRDMRTRMFYDALCDVDCTGNPRRNDDD